MNKPLNFFQPSSQSINNPQAFLDIPNSHSWQRNIIPSNQFHVQSSGQGQGTSGVMEHDQSSPAMIRATSDSALHHSVLQKMNAEKQKNLLSIQNSQIKQRKPESVSISLKQHDLNSFSVVRF